MRKINRSLFFTLILLGVNFMFPSCSKKPDPVYIPGQFAEYTVFNTGSYWIFINDKSGRSDSMYVSTAPSYFFTETGPLYQGCTIRYGGTLFQEGIVNPSEYWMVWRNSISLFCLNYTSFEPNWSGSWNFRNLNYFDSLYVNKQWFYDVVNTQYKILHLGGDTTSYTLFMAKSAGIIKFTIHSKTTDSTWSVIRYKIFKQ